MKPSDLSRSKIGSEPQRCSMVIVVTKCLCYLIVRLPGWGGRTAYRQHGKVVHALCNGYLLQILGNPKLTNSVQRFS